MDKESAKLQQRLLDKLDEWRNSREFGAGKHDKAKYNRAKGMLQATHPTVLTEVLGITSVPDVPRNAMLLIRNMDESTLKNLEIFRGLDDKIVGHHMSAFGAISGILDNQSPERRIELLERAIEKGYITGMDPKGIGPIRTSIHLPVAHENDFSGRKPGYKTAVFSNDDDIEKVWEAFEASLKQQKESFMRARAHGSTQDLVAASEGVFGTDLITDLDQPMDIRAEATKAIRPATAQEIDHISRRHPGDPEAIQAETKAYIQSRPDKEQQRIAAAGQSAIDFKNGAATTKLDPRMLRRSAQGLALAGVAAPFVVGLPASAAEVVIRKQIADESDNPIDKLQLGLASASLTGDFGGPWGEAVSTLADAGNTGIDEVRSFIDDPIGHVTERGKTLVRGALNPAGPGAALTGAEPIIDPLDPIGSVKRFIPGTEEQKKLAKDKKEQGEMLLETVNGSVRWLGDQWNKNWANHPLNPNREEEDKLSVGFAEGGF